MALTDDEKKEILELYGRGYSHRRIADRTDHSETTIRNVINEACREVVKLKDDGLQVEQIASQLDYPLALVSRILRKYEEKQGEKIEAEVEAEVEPEVEVEVSEPPKKLDIKSEWNEFQKDLEIERCKEQIRKRAKESLYFLKDSGDYYKNEGIFDADCDTRQKAIREQLEDFVLVRVDEIDSTEDFSDLEKIYEEIEKKMNPLIEEYDKKASELIRTRKAKEKAYSDELLNSKIGVPMFPDFVKKEMKERFLVKDLEEASIVLDGLFQIALPIITAKDLNPEKEDKMWQEAMGKVRDGKGPYLKQKAAEHNENFKKSLVNINYCPNCNSRLARKYVEGKTIASCQSCSKAWEIIKN